MKRNYRNGLTEIEVEKSRAKYGDNVLTPPEKDPLWKQFLEKFSDPIIRILLIVYRCRRSECFVRAVGYFFGCDVGHNRGLCL